MKEGRGRGRRGRFGRREFRRKGRGATLSGSEERDEGRCDFQRERRPVREMSE